MQHLTKENHRMKTTILAMLLVGATQIATAAPVFMGEQWASQACDAWNADKVLTDELAGEIWVANNGGTGEKIIHFSRTDCKDSPRVQLTISDTDGKAQCSYGGAVKKVELSGDYDYYMYATDEDWQCMADGDWGCGPMGAMMSSKLLFEGPKMEAMSVMGPFSNFLLLTGKVETDRSKCP